MSWAGKYLSGGSWLYDFEVSSFELLELLHYALEVMCPVLGGFAPLMIYDTDGDFHIAERA